MTEVHRKYDAQGNLKTFVGFGARYDYDTNGNCVQYGNTAGFVVRYEYSNCGTKLIHTHRTVKLSS